MKICAACCNELPQSDFSKKQWKLKQYERRCTDCINSNRELQLKPPPKTTNKEDDHKPTCYICLDDGPDELGGKIVRSCSCRGSAGYVHLSCAVNYASQKFKTRKEGEEDPWDTCPNCHQGYTGELAIDMAKNYVTFIEKNYQRNHTMILRAQVIRLESLTCHIRKRSSTQTKEAEQVANTILHKVRQMKVRGISFTKDDRVYEAYAYEILGCMLAEEDDKQKLPEALKYLKKSLEVSTAHDLPTDRVEGIISHMESELDGEYDEESLKMMYEQKIDDLGKSSYGSIKSGLLYARALKLNHQGVKAERLLMELQDISKQHHGSDHEITKAVSDKKSWFRSRIVSVSSNEAGRFQSSSRALSFEDYDDDYDDNIAAIYRFMKYDGSFERCVVKEAQQNGFTSNDEFSLFSDNIIFALGTPVICYDLENPDIDGKLGDVRAWNSESKCYTIHWEDESLEPCEVHQCNVRVPRCICDTCMEGGGELFAGVSV